LLCARQNVQTSPLDFDLLLWGVPPDAQLSLSLIDVEFGQIMATKDHKRLARSLIQGLELRAHVGPPVGEAELLSAREFLHQNDFSLASDYFHRLAQIQHRLETRLPASVVLPAKRNYGGLAAGRWMQLQSAYDHVILSTCYEGEFDLKRGRVKISHRFNQQGRIDFVELKFLRSLQPCLNGEIRSLLRVRDYPSVRKDWRAAEAFILPVLPQELIFLYQDIFRSPRHEVLAWLVNIGHRIAGDLWEDLRKCPANGSASKHGTNGDQLCLQAIRTDEVAAPILEHAAGLESAVELNEPKTAWVRYTRRN
jgi:hypothetical protein